MGRRAKRSRQKPASNADLSDLMRKGRKWVGDNAYLRGEDRPPDTRTARDYMAQTLKIQTREGALAPLIHNRCQIRLDDVYEKAKSTGNPVRIIVLKPRQTGVSTWTMGRMFTRSVRNPNQHCLTLTHDGDSSNWLFNIARIFYDFMPEEEQPEEDYNNRKELIFSAPHMSSISIQTAHDYAGSSFTLQMLQVSELSKWSNPQRTMLSAMQAAAYADIIVESTANGADGQGKYFYDLWKNAREGKNDYIPVFIGWYEHEKYEIRGTHEGSLENLTDEEHALKEKYHLSDGQLAWRRWAIQSLCNGDEEGFRQEYPSNDEEAFRKVEGTRVFPASKCYTSMIRSAAHLDVGNLRWHVTPKFDDAGQCLNKSELSVQWVPDEHGPMRIWEFPNTVDVGGRNIENRFCIAGDVAEGIKGGDFSSAAVLDRYPRLTTDDRRPRIVAAWHGQIDATKFGEILSLMSIYYKNATVAPETNSYGNATLERLMALTTNAWPAYKWMAGQPFALPSDRKWGWYTSPGDSGLRIMMVNRMIDIIRDDMWYDPDEEFWRQAMSVVRSPAGRAVLGGKDRVVARCILGMMDYLMGPIQTVITRSRRPDDYGGDDEDFDDEDGIGGYLTKAFASGRRRKEKELPQPIYHIGRYE